MRRRFDRVLNELKADPFRKRPNADIKLISTVKDGVYRLRMGGYRIIYQVKRKEREVILTILFDRGRGYR